jgi:hypothetical protein
LNGPSRQCCRRGLRDTMHQWEVLTRSQLSGTKVNPRPATYHSPVPACGPPCRGAEIAPPRAVSAPVLPSPALVIVHKLIVSRLTDVDVCATGKMLSGDLGHRRSLRLRFDQGCQLRHLCGRQHNRGLVLVEQASLQMVGLSLHLCLSPSLSRTGEILEANRPPRAEIVKDRWKTAAPYITCNALPTHPSSMPVSIRSHHQDAE